MNNPNEYTIERMKEAWGFKTDKELAEKLGVGPSAISNAKKTQIPQSWVDKASEETNKDKEYFQFTQTIDESGIRAWLHKANTRPKIQKKHMPSIFDYSTTESNSNPLDDFIKSYTSDCKNEVMSRYFFGTAYHDARSKLIEQILHNDKDNLMSKIFPDEKTDDYRILVKAIGDILSKKTLEDKPVKQLLILDDHDFTKIPKVKARLGAGYSLETDGDIEDHFMFKTSWLNKKGRIDSMRLFSVSGESMAPHVNHGDMILIDESQRDIISGELFAVGINEELMVRRISQKPGFVVLESEKYPPLEIDVKEASENFRIIGRALWIGHELV